MAKLLTEMVRDNYDGGFIGRQMSGCGRKVSGRIAGFPIGYAFAGLMAFAVGILAADTEIGRALKKQVGRLG